VNELKVLQKIYPSNIEVLFDVAGDEKRDFFSRIDVLVIPSYCIETGPIVLLESLLYNKKVVAPDVGGPLEFHQAYPEDVLLYSWNNLNDFNDKIITAMKSHFEKESTIEYVQEFNKKQSTFISSHLSIYELGI
jgi:glycosyltransferase involved in cell wall biosynthesis